LALWRWLPAHRGIRSRACRIGAARRLRSRYIRSAGDQDGE
jgi:hypothetical protein